MTHIFISYSHKDKSYARKLAETLEKKGLPVWIDDRIDYGTKWPRVIQDNLDKCSLFIVIMTPRSYQSDWVQNELSRAQEKGKIIFPLLLEGDTTWLSVQSVQYVDVRNGELPPSRFYEMLAKALGKRIAEEPDDAEIYQLHKGDLILGNLRVEKGLAHGDKFVLYKASDPFLARNVLLCVNFMPFSEEKLDETKKSAIIYASMQHPNIPKVYDFFPIGTKQYIILEYIEKEKYEDVVKVIEGLLLS